MKKLYSYALKMKNGKVRQGLILQNGNYLGEIAPLPGFSKESLEEAKTEALLWIQENKAPTLASVRFGVACANRPINSVSVPMYALNEHRDFSSVKLKLKDYCVQEAVRFVKDRLHQGRLRLDCNKKWSLDEAFFFVSHFKKEDFEYLEEPVQDFVTLQKFSEKTGFPIAVDESIGSDLSKIPSLKTIIVKPTIVGHVPTPPKGIDLVLSSSFESGIGLLHIANLAKPGMIVGLDTYKELAEDLLKKPIRTEKDRFTYHFEKEIPIDWEKLCPVV